MRDRRGMAERAETAAAALSRLVPGLNSLVPSATFPVASQTSVILYGELRFRNPTMMCCHEHDGPSQKSDPNGRTPKGRNSPCRSARRPGAAVRRRHRIRPFRPFRHSRPIRRFRRVHRRSAARRAAAASRRCHPHPPRRRSPRRRSLRRPAPRRRSLRHRRRRRSLRHHRLHPRRSLRRHRRHHRPPRSEDADHRRRSRPQPPTR